MSDWAGSGGAWLTGWPGRPALLPVGDPLGWAAAHAARVTAWAGVRGFDAVIDPALCLFGRAGSAGLKRRGRTSAGGACRLLQAADGWVAVNLARPDDVELLPAWLGTDADPSDPWREVDEAVAAVRSEALIEGATLLGMPVAALGERTVGVPSVRVVRVGAPHPTPRRDVGMVVDLSAMWAGPLSAQLLGLAGGRIVKVEGADRLDGARLGDHRFYDWLHRGHESVVLDLRASAGVAALRALLGGADVVIEASRPRALGQLGIDLGELVAARGGVWLSITGHGREAPHADRVAFGDDAAVAGGLVAWDDDRLPVFCGDAIADPLTGLSAASGVLDAIDAGGGVRVEVAMASVAAEVAGLASPLGAPIEDAEVARPPHLPVGAAAAVPGEHTDAVLAELLGRA